MAVFTSTCGAAKWLTSTASPKEKVTFFQVIKVSSACPVREQGQHFLLHFEMIKTVTLSNLDTF
jgi:hypothetical protein